MPEERAALDFWEITNLRRVELGKKWKDVLAETGLSHETLNRWRKALKVDPLTDRAFERALLWEPGARTAADEGRHPTPLAPAPEASTPDEADSDSEPTPNAGLSPGEALRHVISASAQRLGLGADDLEPVFQAVRSDLVQAEAARNSDPVDFPPYGTPDLSAMVLEARLAAGLSLEDVARLTAEAPGAPAGLDEGWLSRLESASLTPDEFPEYPQLDALAYALHLDPARVQEAAGVQYRNVHSVWSDDGQSRAVVVGEVSAEDRRKLEALMRMYRRAPKK
jgi:transcriptional regulator with XRE-family HTH domain